MSKGPDLTFHLRVLGRTLEHLGVQMYKKRAPAIAELVANAWDAYATKVEIRIPDESVYGIDSEITIYDDGLGMNPDQIDNEYLVVGRNRRSYGGGYCNGRPVMGRKGIGKLAGFGIAKVMTMVTWKDGIGTEFSLDTDQLKTTDNHVQDCEIQGKKVTISPEMGEHGTIVRLHNLKSATPLKADSLHDFLARRFSRRIKGEMAIEINDLPLKDPTMDLVHRYPQDGLQSDDLGDNKIVKYHYAFSRSVPA